jgi:hypothetical protein
VLESVEYEYRVTKGTWKIVAGSPQWFWSAGAVALGKRQATVISYPMGEFSDYWPANMWNYMSVFYVPFGAEHRVEGLRNTAYPPQGEWVHYGGETLGYAHTACRKCWRTSAVRGLSAESLDNGADHGGVAGRQRVWSQSPRSRPRLVSWEEPLF